MFWQSSHARKPGDIGGMEERMRRLEQRLERMGSRNVNGERSSISRATDGVGEIIASALAHVADQFRGSTRSYGGDPAQFGRDAAKLGNDALRRIGVEVKQRPLMMLAIAAAVGLVAGIVGRRD